LCYHKSMDDNLLNNQGTSQTGISRSDSFSSAQGNVPPPAQDDGSMGSQAPSLKEQKELLSQVKSQEKGLDAIRFKEYKEVELGGEVKDWLTELESADASQLSAPIIDDYGQILLDNSNQPKPQVILPLKEEEVEKAIHQKVADSIRWLAVWCLRMVKLLGKRAEFEK